MLPWPVWAAILGAGGAARAVGRAANAAETQEAILNEYRSLFNVPLDRLQSVKARLLHEMELGLRGERGGLMMLPSFVDVLPSGDERGEVYGIDLGGTNLRVLWVRLGPGRGEVEAQAVAEWPIPEECYDTDNGRLMDWVAECAAGVMAEHGAAAAAAAAPPPLVGFCFSFACEQTSLGDGKLLLWTKSFRGGGLVGRDVVAALVAAFARRGLVVRVPALMNDTVATLVALCYSHPATRAGIILGTGTNCAYIEATAGIEKLAPPPPGAPPRGPAMVVNTEWGDLDAAGEALPLCEEDLWVDCASANPGHGRFEKLISGLYLGEVARRILLRLAERGGLFGGARRCGGLAREGALGAADVAAIDQDATPGLQATAQTLCQALGLRGRVSARDRRTAAEVCRLVALRSARLCAAAIAAVVDRAGGVPPGGGQFVIAVDGSVFTKYPAYRGKLQAALAEVMGGEAAAAVALRVADGGSVAGAAYLAAAAAAR